MLQARVEGDPVKRKDVYDQVMALLAIDVPYVYLNHDNVLFGVSKAVTGFKFVPDGVIRTVSLGK